ncbi:MAG: PIN domain-containing protein [Patescibacteria group bacterium]
MVANIGLSTVSTKTLLIDTGPLLALANNKDSSHNQTKLLLKRIKLEKKVLLITNTTVYECYTRILYDVGWTAAIGFLNDLENSDMLIELITQEDEKEAKSILNKYKNSKISFVDALNFAVMKRKGYLYAFTYDKDFSIVGFIQYI